MPSDEMVRPRLAARYEGEDTSIITQRELNGWYSYAIAAEVFAVVATGAFLPVTLEQLSRERGFLFSDKSRPCVAQTRSLSGQDSMRNLLTRANDAKQDQCVINFLGMGITTASFAMYTQSAAVLVQAITLICFSSFADHGPYRKKMLMMFAYTGSVVSVLFIVISPAIYYLAPILAIIGVTCLGCSFTLLNAFLPLLVSNHEGKYIDDFTSSDFELEALNPESNIRRHDPEKLSRDLQLSANISSKGVGLGYMAAVFVQLISVVILFIFSKTSISKSNPSLPMRVVLSLVGIWWATFTTPTLLWLRPRPGPPLPVQLKPHSRQFSRYRTFLFYTMFSLSSFWNTVKRAWSLRQVFLFLTAWFLLSDAIATISGTAVLFARTELEMGTIAIALLSITVIGSGIVGAFALPRISACYSLEPKSVFLLCAVLIEIVPLYGLLGYIPVLQRAKVGGLQQPWEIYPLGAFHGFIMGGISSYSRSVFTPLIPEGSEAAFFALFAVTDKGSSAFGPALVGWIVDRAGTIRPAFIFLAVLALCPGPLIYMVDVERGRGDAARMVETDGRRHEDTDTSQESRSML
ncbi:autophagy-related protein 22-1 [Lindgomyces ingoldianus]|uniref:Autophagy-related protein 22-1 n=1 Tax=Lindgomyces ingoldianus TaxID=673940 RepID=A0ACB6RA12_9PLEO|nr:autophagy-related protein 22-1 [Lindgomyces ingoldianus]KAF2475175.1 autophagy-related protein 22-1 [Lindgomyces ingoldianus]